MLKKDELKHPHSCLNRAFDNEPLFVLRANDPLASECVRYWADRYKQTKDSAGNPDGFTERNAKKYQEARIIADAMEDWSPPKQPHNGDSEGRYHAATLGIDPRSRTEAPSREEYEATRERTVVEELNMLSEQLKEAREQLDAARETIDEHNADVKRLHELKDALIKDNFQLTALLRDTRSEINRAIQALTSLSVVPS